VPVGLVLVGVSLVLGLFTTLGCWGALLLLGSFYVTAIPVAGTTGPHQEGAYLIVNKNLVELVAVIVLLAFRTGRIAGLDLLRHGSRRSTSASAATAATSGG
jgi:thiosulfate dehydrogenase (quinone) large subunit